MTIYMSSITLTLFWNLHVQQKIFVFMAQLTLCIVVGLQAHI